MIIKNKKATLTAQIFAELIFAELIFAIYDPHREIKFRGTWKYPIFSKKPHDFTEKCTKYRRKTQK